VDTPCAFPKALEVELAFLDLPGKLDTGDHNRGMVEALESQHQARATFDTTVVLFNNVIEVLTGAQERIGREDLVLPEFLDCPMRGLVPIQGDLLRRAVTQDSFSEEGLGGRDIPVCAEVEIDCLPRLVNRPVEVDPLTFDLDRGPIHPPRTLDRLDILVPPLLEHRDKANHPAHDRGVCHREAPFRHHLHEIAVAELIPHVPADTEGDDQTIEVAAFK
jgi:hypothetical protein